jgi:hypothetical protein
VQALTDDPVNRALLSEIVSNGAPARVDGQARA